MVWNHKTLQQILRTAEKIIGVSFSSFKDICTMCCIRKATIIVDHHTQTPSHTLFTLLPSGKSYQGIQALMLKLCNRFFPQSHQNPQYSETIVILQKKHTCILTNTHLMKFLHISFLNCCYIVNIILFSPGHLY